MLCTQRIKIRDDGDDVWGNGGRNECVEEEGRNGGSAQEEEGYVWKTVGGRGVGTEEGA